MMAAIHKRWATKPKPTKMRANNRKTAMRHPIVATIGRRAIPGHSGLTTDLSHGSQGMVEAQCRVEPQR
jgi:hypothetical protein